VQMNDDNIKYREIYISTFNCFVKSITQQELNEITKCEKLVSTIRGNGNITNFTNLKMFNPLNPTNYIDGINKDIRIFKSSTKPLHITCKPSGSFMFKYIDVRKDQLIMNIIRTMDIILKKHNVNMNIITYNIIPTSNRDGLIEFVPNSKTIYDIQSTSTIQNYILENNSNMIVDDIRIRFIKSTAIYCVITYLLGIGDRHMDNMLVTQDGKLFHIDYSFVLGYDPKPLAPQMKITTDIIDAFGGMNSVYYKLFEDECTKCYDILRRYFNLFINMLSLLTKLDEKFTINELEQEIAKRCLPGEYSIEAKVQLIKTINNSKNVTVISTLATDYIHHYYKILTSVWS